MKALRNTAKIVAAFLVVLGLAGCSGEYSGGGAMPSASGVPGEKATFGFTIYAFNDGVSCDEIVSATGQFQYVDHGTGVNVAFHAKIVDFAGAFADPDFNVAPLFIADYYVKGKKAGQVLIGAMDYGNASKIDRVMVSVLDGPFAGYSNSGAFEKGNITYTPDPLCE